MSFVETGPLLLPEQTSGMIRRMILPSLEALQRQSLQLGHLCYAGYGEAGIAGEILGGGHPVGERAVTFIVEAESNAELDDLLQELPFWGVLKSEVTPLQSFAGRRESTRQLVERVEASLAEQMP